MALDLWAVDWDTLDNPVAQELAWRAAEKDIELFLSKCWNITLPGAPPAPLVPWEAQKKVLKEYAEHERVLSLKARQIGWTTITTAFVGHDIIFSQFHPWLFVSRTGGAAIKNLLMVANGLRRLPRWMQERIKFDEWKITQDFIETAHGSWVESIAATGGTGRGEAVYGVMWDEAAFAEAAEGMYAALEPLTYGKFFVLSTANGMGNWFHAKWVDSNLPGATWQPVFFPWNARITRDEVWYEKKKRDYRGQPWLFYQEYPANPEEAFAKSGRTAIDANLLDEYDWAETWERLGWDGSAFTQPLDQYDEEHYLFIDVYERPTVERHPVHGYALRAPNYVIFCDVAQGLEHGDYTAIVVYNANTGACAARVRTHYNLEGIPEVLESLGSWYHNALVAVEREYQGFFVNHTLAKVLGYPRVYRMAQLNKRQTTERTDVYGWSTNMSTKPKMVNDALRFLRDHEVDPRDPWFRSECSTFVVDDKGKYGASGGNHDDVVMAHLGAMQLLTEISRFPVVWRDEKTTVITMAEFDELAFGSPTRKGIQRVGDRNNAESTRKQSFFVHRTG